MPADSVDEYLADGRPITVEEVSPRELRGRVLVAGDDGVPIRDEQGLEVELEDGEGVYLRKLVDYDVLLNEFYRLRSKWVDYYEAATRDRQYMESAVASTRSSRSASSASA